MERKADPIKGASRICKPMKGSMAQENLSRLAIASGLAALLAGTSGCKELPGTPKQQGTAIGGASGAAAGAVIAGSEHRLLGALLGGAIGAAGGYLIGANSDSISGNDSKGARDAVTRAQTNPATAEQARNAATADINGDGFVTMDEVVAMKQAGLPDQVMIDKLRATGQVFELTPQQQQYLANNGVSQSVINEMPQLNREARDKVLSQKSSSQTTPTAQPPPPPIVGKPAY